MGEPTTKIMDRVNPARLSSSSCSGVSWMTVPFGRLERIAGLGIEGIKGMADLGMVAVVGWYTDY